MRGWLSSRVVDRSAMSALSCTCRSRSRWISGEESTSGKRIERAALLQRLAHALSRRFGRGAAGAHARQFGGELRQLLRGENRIVLADQQVRLGAEIGDARLGLLHALVEIGDLGRQPVGGIGIRSELGVAADRQIGIGERVRHLGRQLRVLGRELDDDDAGLLHPVDVQLFAERLQHALVGGNFVRVALQPGENEQPRQHGHVGRGIEFRQLRQVELLGTCLRMSVEVMTSTWLVTPFLVEDWPIRLSAGRGA